MTEQSPPDTLAQAVIAAAIPVGARILVAVSGGPDSVALLDTLHRAAVMPGCHWQLRVAHINHMLRGEEASQDERFVIRLAKQLGLESDAIRVDTATFARQRRLSLESAARLLRYDALERLLHEWQGDVIATGHTQDDQAETVLFRALRGSGLSGLSGMRTWRGSIVRPFLTVTHETLVRTLQERGLGYRLDSSNRDPRHTRNRIRRDVVPVLESIQPRAQAVLARTAALLGRDADLLDIETERTLRYLDLQMSNNRLSASVSVLRALHPSLRAATLRRLIQHFGDPLRDVHQMHVDAVEAAIGDSREGPQHGLLPSGVVVEIAGGRLVLMRDVEQVESLLGSASLSIPGRLHLAVGTFSADLLSPEARADLQVFLAVAGPMHAFADRAAIGEELTVRPWKPGDRIRPLGMTGTRKLQDIFVDRHVARSDRTLLPVVCQGDTPIWIPGVVLSGAAAVGPHTSDIVHLIYTASGRRGRDRLR